MFFGQGTGLKTGGYAISQSHILVKCPVPAFNTVWTYDLYQAYLAPNKSDQHYFWMGQAATVAGILVSIGAAYFASLYNNAMDIIQLVFGFVNAPLFATFLLGMFWKRTTSIGAFLGLFGGIAVPALITLAWQYEVTYVSQPSSIAFAPLVFDRISRAGAEAEGFLRPGPFRPLPVFRVDRQVVRHRQRVVLDHQAAAHHRRQVLLGEKWQSVTTDSGTLPEN
jgi:hypothetical protein